MKWADFLVVIVAAITVSLMLAVAVGAGLRVADEQAACEERGGLLVRAAGGRLVCLEGAKD